MHIMRQRFRVDIFSPNDTNIFYWHAAVSYFTSTIVNLEQKNKLILLHSIRYKTDKDLSFFW